MWSRFYSDDMSYFQRLISGSVPDISPKCAGETGGIIFRKLHRSLKRLTGTTGGYKVGPLRSLQMELWGPYKWKIHGFSWGEKTVLITGRGWYLVLESQAFLFHGWSHGDLHPIFPCYQLERIQLIAFSDVEEKWMFISTWYHATNSF